MNLWYIIICSTMFSVSHMNQETDVIAQLDRLDINLESGNAMLSALCEEEGLDVSSILSDGHAHASQVSSPCLLAAAPLAAPVETDGWNNDGTGGTS